MPSESSFKEQVAKFRQELQTSEQSKCMLSTLNRMQIYVDGFNDDSNQTICAAHLAKELVDWISQKQDVILQTETGMFCISLLDRLLSFCHTAQHAVSSYCVARLYNAVITLNAQSNSQLLMMRICGLISHFPITEEQENLFERMKRVVLKAVQDCAKSPGLNTEDVAIDLVIKIQCKLLVHASNKPRDGQGTRPTALNLFREVFDTSMAVLYRIFTISRPKAHKLFQTIMKTMTTIVQPDEVELISLLNDSVGFVETIVKFSADVAEYLQFAQFLDIFTGVNREPYASCYNLLRQQVKLQQQTRPTSLEIKAHTDRLRTLHARFPTDALVMKVVIFLTCQGAACFNSLPPDVALSVSDATIDFFQSLMPFVRHCPAGTVQELCRKCTSSRRHMADRLLTIMVHMYIFQVKDAVEIKTNPSYSVGRVCELIKKKLNMLEDLGCERKRSLIDTTVRQSVTWVKYALTVLRDDPLCADDAVEVLEVLKLLIATQNQHRFDFLSNLHLVRLLENCYIEKPVCTPAQASSSCWSGASVRMLKLLLAIRDGAGDASEEDHVASLTSIIRSIMFYQINAPEGDQIRSFTTVQLYDHPSFDRHGFSFDCVPTSKEKFTILAIEMALAVKYKTAVPFAPCEYFLQLHQLGGLRENCLTFGMALYGFGETDAAKIPAEIIDDLRASLSAYKPSNIHERIKRSASLAVASYHSFSLLSRASLDRMRHVPFKIDNFRNDQIDEMLVESQLDRESKLIDHMESIRKHYSEMIAALAEESFRSLWLVPSVVQVANILDSTARYFQLNYYPHRAIELQLLSLLLVSQRREKRPLDQCSPLGFLLENHRQTEALLQHFSLDGSGKLPKHAGGKLDSIEDISKRAISLLETFSKPAQRFTNDVPENRKFQFLNLYLGLAIFHASKGELNQSLELCQQTLAHLPQAEMPPSCKSKDAVKTPSTIETVGLLMKGRTAQIIFRLMVEYDLPWPGPDCEVPPVCTFLKLMLANFNELQKLPNEHTFVVSLATVEMTVAVLQYLIVRYDTSSLIEPYVDQLLKFVIRRGAGLRMMQVLLLYGFMSADMQKLDRCEITIRYLDRLLMLRPIPSYQRKEDFKHIEESILTNENLQDHHRHRMQIILQPVAESDVDDERKATPKYLENSLTPSIGRIHSPLDVDLSEPSIEQYLMFRHLANCECCYCSYPQYKSMAYQTAALAARLSALKRLPSTKRTENSYHSLVEHWPSVLETAFDRTTAWFDDAYREDLVTVGFRMFVQWGQFLGMLRRFAPAFEAYERAFELSEMDELKVTIDAAIIEDLHFNITSMKIAQKKRFDSDQPVRHKKSRSMICQSYQEMLAVRKTNTNEISPLATEKAPFSTELQTPKQPPSTLQAGRNRAPPKTADRVNELIRQAATRRHQLKKNVADELLIPTLTPLPSRSYSASARKPKTVDVFVDSPPGGLSEKVPATVGRRRITSSSKQPKETKRVQVVNLCEEDKSEGSSGNIETNPTPIGKSVDVRNRYNRRIRKMVSGEEDPTTPLNNSSDTYKAALLKNLPCTPDRNGAKREKAKMRGLVAEDFPSLSESNDHAKSPRPSPAKTVKRDPASPGLSGLLRDSLVLVDPPMDDASSVIVLDDSVDDAIEASFVDNRVLSTGKNAVLSLKPYSDRKRLLNGSGSTFSPAIGSALSKKRRTPLLVSKTKLRYDDGSPEHMEVDSLTSDECVQKTDHKQILPEEDMLLQKGFVSARRNARKKVQKTNQPTDIVLKKTNIPTKTAGPSEENIATRTRLRRKRI